MGCGCVVFFKQKAAYEMLISCWSSDVCSSDLCSATIRTLDMGKTSCGAGFNPPSESVGAADGGSGPALQEALLLQCGNQFGRVLHHHAAAALGQIGRAWCRE